jgi:5-methylcytosine-specific restriction protein A
MAKVTEEMITNAYIIAKKVYNKELSPSDGLCKLVNSDINWSKKYANIHIHNLKILILNDGNILNMSEISLRLYLFYIQIDFGENAFTNSLITIKRCIDNYKKNKSNISSLIRIYRDFSNVKNEIKNKPLIENNIIKRFVRIHERNLVARKECLEYYGYRCAICNVLLSDVYGDLGKEFIHVHHLNEISTIKEEYIINPIKDLRPLCPNCHSIIHRRSPPYEIEEIKKIIKL